MFLNKRNKQLMAKKLDQKEIVDLKELLMSEVIQSEALINLLDKKGIISKQELLEEMKRVQATMIKSKKG
jgi:predicted nucleic acid-binding protein